MIADMVSLEATVLSFETVLKIEYEEQSAKKVVESSIKKLENAYGVRMQGKSLYDLEAENINVAPVVKCYFTTGS